MKKKINNALRLNKKKILLLTAFAISILFLQFSTAPLAPEKKLEDYYFSQLKNFETQLSTLDNQLLKKTPIKTLQQSFFKIRLAYKRFAAITEYYNVYDSKQMNGPDVLFAEDDNRKTSYPHGLQVVEGKLFSENSIDYAALQREVEAMLAVNGRWLKESDPEKKFTGPLVFDALQFSMIRLMTMGIAGFDSPTAQNSLPEAAATIESLQTILGFYQAKINGKTRESYNQLQKLLQQSIAYVDTHSNFNSFDRMAFLKKYLSPAYSLLVTIREATGFEKPIEKSPFRTTVRSIFDSSFFNVDFFSPNQRFRLTKERIELGNKLFYDPALSGSKKRSCASCHKPELAFTDGLATALAMDEKKHLLRNTPTLWNSALQTRQFYDSRTSTLENQLSDVVHNAEEMKGALKESVVAFKKDSAYRDLFEKAYPDVAEKISDYNIANAISSYMRSLISLNSKFDQYMRGNEKAMNASEKNGFNIFMGKGKCGTCHYMPLFNGLVPPQFTETESEVLGVPSTKDTLHAVLDADKGKMNFTKAEVHQYAFKIPSLRNVALTAPYMHNGVYSTLEEVMDFYNKGGGNGLHIAPSNETLPADKLNLSKKEIEDVIAFLKTLTSVKN